MGTTNNRSASNHSGGKTSKSPSQNGKRDPYASIEKRAVKNPVPVMVERRNNGSIIGFTFKSRKNVGYNSKSINICYLFLSGNNFIVCYEFS